MPELVRAAGETLAIAGEEGVGVALVGLAVFGGWLFALAAVFTHRGEK